MKKPLIIYWSRRDFRLTDNSALSRAALQSREKGIPFLPLFILEDYMVEAKPDHQFGYPSRWFLAQALPEFGKQFKEFAVVRGKAAQYVSALNDRYELTIFVNDDVYPDFYTQIEKIKAAGVNIIVCSDALSVSKETRTGEGKMYSVFTPFKKSVWSEFVQTKPLPVVATESIVYAEPAVLKDVPNRIEMDSRTLWNTFSHERTLNVDKRSIDLAKITPEAKLEGWYVSEKGAENRFKQYLEYDLMAAYDSGRDSLESDVSITTRARGALEGKTSRMSLALAWGLISSRTLMHMLREHFNELFDNPFSDRVNQGALIYISELIWREFYRYLFFHNPSLMHTEFQIRFRGTIEWVPENLAHDRFLSWIKGETGYPIVDAAMHQIARTGWMHNRARMIVASILTKNLGVDWRWGQEYFRAVLIDLDEASNNGGWQWGASVGADPKPIRIFNPYLQAKNYDASGAYVEHWLSADNLLLKEEILPLVEHTLAREDALRRYGLSKTEPRDY